jgi:hypothetical protein
MPEKASQEWLLSVQLPYFQPLMALMTRQTAVNAKTPRGKGATGWELARGRQASTY